MYQASRLPLDKLCSLHFILQNSRTLISSSLPNLGEMFVDVLQMLIMCSHDFSQMLSIYAMFSQHGISFVSLCLLMLRNVYLKVSQNPDFAACSTDPASLARRKRRGEHRVRRGSRARFVRPPPHPAMAKGSDTANLFGNHRRS